MFDSAQEKDQFIAHLTHLLNLKDVRRCRRSDWQQMKALLAQAGYWKRRYRQKPYDNMVCRKRMKTMQELYKKNKRKVDIIEGHRSPDDN